MSYMKAKVIRFIHEQIMTLVVYHTNWMEFQARLMFDRKDKVYKKYFEVPQRAASEKPYDFLKKRHLS